MNSTQTSRAQAALDALIAAGLIDAAVGRRALGAALASGQPVAAALHQLALADDRGVADALASHFGLKRVAASDLPAAPLDGVNVSTAFLRRKHLLPLGWAGGALIVGIADPEESDGLAALSFAAGCAADPRLMSYSEWRSAFDALYGATTEPETAHETTAPQTAWTDDALRLRDQANGSPAVRLVDAVLERAIEQGASDIHIEPLPDRVRVRLRIDGELRTLQEEPAFLAAPIAARIKILADMDVANRRSPQDGRTSLAAKGRPIDVRISSVPSSHGETIALRLLRRDPALLDLRRLGFSDALLDLFEHVLSLRRGLFLVTGPTGSGKTTTLYAMLERLRAHNLKILSIEDPIEYFFNDVTQTQVNEAAGVSFASALRSFLRQDPDVILVGEIRDAETARIAVQAALTGHLVLATLHTVDAAGAVARLVDMGVDRYLVSATLNGAISQRLMRRLCPSCKRQRAASDLERETLQRANGQLALFNPAGCEACGGRGHRDRLAIGEGFRVTDTLREAMLDPSGLALTQHLRGIGFLPLMADAERLVLAGEASFAELRALSVA